MDHFVHQLQNYNHKKYVEMISLNLTMTVIMCLGNPSITFKNNLQQVYVSTVLATAI